VKKPLESAKDEDLRGSWSALLRAASAARKTAILTNTDLIVSENGRVKRIPLGGVEALAPRTKPEEP